MQRPPPTTLLSLGALVAANLGVAVGALTGALRFADVLLLYWAESAVIGVFSILKMAIAARWAAFFFVPFFCFHAGMFMLAHLFFLNLLFLNADRFNPLATIPAVLVGLAWPLAILTVSHAISFVLHFIRSGERARDPGSAMGAFYARIFVMHVTIIVSGFLSVLLGSPAWAVVVLVVLKTGADAFSHLLQHKPRPISPPSGVANPS